MNSTNLKQVNGGKVIASGDTSSEFSYELLDENFNKLTTSGDATLTLINKTDGLAYVHEIKQVTEGVISFTLPILKRDVYQVAIKYEDAIYPSDGSVYIIVEKNPDDAILNTVDPITIETYLGDYAKKTDVPAITGLATEEYVTATIDSRIGDISTPDLSGLATEEYVNDTIAAIVPVSTVGLATEVYVNNQIAAIPIPEPVDTSNFITKPLTYPILATDPASKDYVDDAVSGLTGGGGGTTEGGSWTTIASGEYDSFSYNAYRYMIDNGFSIFRVMMSINSDATEFNLNFRHSYPTHSIISEYLNLNSKMSTDNLIFGGNIHRNGGKAYVVIDYEFLPDKFLDLGDSNATMTVSIYSNEFALLSTVSGSTPSFNYVPNFKRLINLRGDQFGESILSCNGFVGNTFKKVKGIFKGYK